jgi:lysophospholipase L1-like esterase
MFLTRSTYTFLALLLCPMVAPAVPQVLIEAGSSCSYLANSSDPGIENSWITEAFDATAWSSGSYGIGYENDSGAGNLLQTTVPVDTRSIYTRSSFTITDISSISKVTLGVDYDDGYIAWINGKEVFRSAVMPSGTPDWDANPGLHESSNGANPVYTPLRDISAAAIPVLHNGTNVLAIGAWNSIGSSGSSSDLVLVPQLSVDTTTGGGAVLFESDFNDGGTSGWTVIDNCEKGTSSWSVVNTVLMQTGACRAFTPEGIATGTTFLQSLALPANVDIRLRLRAEDPDSDAVASNDGDTHRYGAMGVEFGYQDSDNYYRLEISGIRGHRKLWRNQAGTFTELNTSPQSYVRGQWLDLRIIHQNGVIIVFADGKQIMAAADDTFNGGQLALFCARNVSCSFDDVKVMEAPSEPVIGLSLPDGFSPAHASSEYFVDTDGVLDVAALITRTNGIGGVEFVIDEGTGAEVSSTDQTSPYSAGFALAPGEHTVVAHLMDTGGASLSASDASASFLQVGTGGIHLVCMGDSITAGLTDDVQADDRSADNRNTGGGYEPILNDYLSAANGVPVTVINDGIPGDESSLAAARIGLVLERFPAAQAFLVAYGTNDSSGTMPLDSGFGLAPGQQGYAGSYKDYMQQIVDAVIDAGKLVYLSKVPFYPKRSGQDAIIQDYNLVIDELVNQLGTDYPSDYSTFVAPDMHGYFSDNSGEIGSDLVHPDGTGHQSMGRLWCEALNGQQGLFCLDDDKDGLVNSVETLIGTNPLQADSDGDGLVDGPDGIVRLAIVAGAVDTNGDGYADGEQVFGTDPLQDDSDGDRLDDGLEAGNNADPLDSDSWPILADGDIAPLGAPDGNVNAGDIVVGMRFVLGLESATALELAHGDLYPPGSPDGVFNLQDLVLLRQLP